MRGENLMYITLNQFLQRVWYIQKIEVRNHAADGEIVLAGESFIVQRDPNYQRYEDIYISSFGADESKLIIVLN